MACFCKEKRGSGLMVTEKLVCIQKQHYFHPECGPSGNLTKCPYCYTPGPFVDVMTPEMPGSTSERAQDLKGFLGTRRSLMASTTALQVEKKASPATSQTQVFSKRRGAIVSDSGRVDSAVTDIRQTGETPLSPSTSNEDEIDTEVDDLTDEDSGDMITGDSTGDVGGVISLKSISPGIPKFGTGNSEVVPGNGNELLATTSNVVKMATLSKTGGNRCVPKILGNMPSFERSGRGGVLKRGITKTVKSKLRGSSGKYTGKQTDRLAFTKTGPKKVPKESRSKHQYTCGTCQKIHGSRTCKYNCCKEPVQCSCGKTFAPTGNLKVHARKFNHRIL